MREIYYSGDWRPLDCRLKSPLISDDLLYEEEPEPNVFEM